MGLRKELLLLALMPGIAVAQAFDFDMTKEQPVYSQEIGYGYDVVAAPDKKKPNAPYFFSV